MSELGAISTGGRRKPKGPPAWPGLLAAVVLGGLMVAGLVVWRGIALSMPPHPPQTAAIGEVLGLAAACAIVAWLAIWAAYVRNTGRKVGAPFFFIVLAITLAVGLAVAAWRGQPSPDEQLTASAQALAAQSRKALSDDTYAFNAEFAPLQWGPLLTANGLANDPTLANVKGKLAAMHALVARYRAKGLARETALRAQLEKLASTPEARAKAAGVYEAAMGGTTGLEARYWAMQEATLADGDWIVAMLTRARGNWKAAGVYIIFRGNGDQPGYQSHLTHLQTVATQMNPVAEALAHPETPIPVKPQP